jgi:hypothetical protein
MASHEKVILPIAGTVAPFSGDCKRKQGISVGVEDGVDVGGNVSVGGDVLAGVFVFIGVGPRESFGDGFTNRVQAARNTPKLIPDNLKKSRRVMLFLFII